MFNNICINPLKKELAAFMRPLVNHFISEKAQYLKDKFS